jgi:hypothetical protein
MQNIMLIYLAAAEEAEESEDEDEGEDGDEEKKVKLPFSVYGLLSAVCCLSPFRNSGFIRLIWSKGCKS